MLEFEPLFGKQRNVKRRHRFVFKLEDGTEIETRPYKDAEQWDVSTTLPLSIMWQSARMQLNHNELEGENAPYGDLLPFEVVDD